MRTLGLAVAACLLAGPVFGQQVLLTESFDTEGANWTTIGGAKVAIVKDAAQAKTGTGVMRYDYEVKKGAPSLLLHPISSAPPSTVKGFRFWVKTDAATWVAMVLQERGGPRYAAAFQSPGNAWQQVELGIADFGPGLDKNDPKDPNNKLDITEVEGIGLLDMSVMMAEDGSGQMLKMLGLKGGPRTLWLDEVEVLSALTTVLAPSFEGEIVLDALARPQIGWLATGWVKPSLATGAPLDGRSVKLEYKRNTGEVAAIVRFLPQGRLDGTSGLRFRAASVQATTLLVQVEEATGGKYNAVVELPGGSQAKDAAPTWADLTADAESKDDNGELDPAQIKQILILDLASLSGDGQANTLWVGPMRAVKAK